MSGRQQKMHVESGSVRRQPFIIGAAIAIGLFSSGSSLSAPGKVSDITAAPPNYGEKCLYLLRNTTAIDHQSRLRFALHKPTVSYSDHKKDLVLAVDPARLDIRSLSCAPRLSPDGALQVESVSLWLGAIALIRRADRPVVPSGAAFWATFSDMAPSAIENSGKDYIRRGNWQPRGSRYGLGLYRLVFALTEKRPTKNSIYLGANFFGKTKAGNFIRISCIDFDTRLDVACRLTEEMTPNVLFSMEISTRQLERWPQYVTAAEEYFSQNIEHRR